MMSLSKLGLGITRGRCCSLGGGGGAVIDVIEFSALPSAFFGTDEMINSPATTMARDTYKRFYLSHWVRLPGTTGLDNWRAPGIMFGERSSGSSNPTVGLRLAYDDTTTNLWHLYADIYIDRPAIPHVYTTTTTDNCISTTSGSDIIRFTFTGADTYADIGEPVLISGATGVGGLLAGEINGTRNIWDVGAGYFEVVADTTASSSTTGGGTAISVTTYEIFAPAYQGKKYTFAGNASPQWKHILIEYDSTEVTRANRFKLYINDTKVVHTELDSDFDSNNYLLPQVDPDNTFGALMDFAVGEYVPGQMGTEISNALDTGGEPFVTVASLSQVAGTWFKLATANLFDFDVAADRRNFINASLQYVTHAATMGGQTATVWGAGTSGNWVAQGFVEEGTVDDTTAASPITAS